MIIKREKEYRQLREAYEAKENRLIILSGRFGVAGASVCTGKCGILLSGGRVCTGEAEAIIESLLGPAL